MYLDHFGLKDSPFTIAPNPHYLFMSSRHRDALAHLLYGVKTDGGFILLTGEVGTGKTTLCRCLLEQIPDDVDIAYVLNPRVTVIELLATICDEYGIEYNRDVSAKHLVDLLSRFLLDGHAEGRRAVVIIDEAQNLSAELLEQLRLLTNLETNERKLLQIILLGQPELLELLAKQELRQFSQRITARFHLDALAFGETAEYISHRLEIAGLRNNVFSNAAVKTVFKLSGGVPRVINLICDRSLLGAYAQDQNEVSAAIVRRAAAEVLGPKPSGKTHQRRYRWSLAAAVAVALVAVAAGIGYLNLSQRHVEPATAEIAEITSPPQRASAQVQVQVQAKQSDAAPAALDLKGHATLDTAYHDLFALWGSAFEDRSAPACELAPNIGLMCHERPLSIDVLTQLNRPAIVTAGGVYLTISDLDNSTVTLIAGNQEYRLSRDQFEKSFGGSMHLLWRTPPMYQAYQRPLQRDDSGPAVDWLLALMAAIEGGQPPSQMGQSFTVDLENRVINFQTSVGLPATGVVDIDTWIQLNSAQPDSIPMLVALQTG